MAIDQALLRNAPETPVLRLYEWEGAWVSVGYFGDLEAARDECGPEVSVVRRPTGGGVVDHRVDVTYTLVVPTRHELARMGRGEAYRLIHEGVVLALNAVGISARQVTEDSTIDSVHCFEKAVAWDVSDASGRKLAGAGQRRTRAGFLHQGSVLIGDDKDLKEQFRNALPGCLAHRTAPWAPMSVGNLQSSSQPAVDGDGHRR